MRLALLHRRLAAAMALAALLAFAAGFGLGSPLVLAAAAALAIPVFWRIPIAWRGWVDRVSGVVTLALFAWVLYTAFLVEGDFLIPVLSLLLFLLVGEILRPIMPEPGKSERHDLRLYALSFSLLVAATAYSPGPLFGAAFIAYIAAAALTLMVGYLSREAERFSTPDIYIGRNFLLTTAALSALIVVMSVGVFLLFPRLPRSLIGAPRNSAAQTMVGFSDEVSIAEFGTSIAANPEIVFRAEFPDGAPDDFDSLHWRGRSFDHFDGWRWSHSRWLPPSPPAGFYRARWGGPTQRYQIFGGPPGVRVLFGLHPVLAVERRSRIRPFSLPSGDQMFGGSEVPVYLSTSLTRQPSPAELREAPADDPIALFPYLQLPDLDARVLALADSLLGGSASRFDRTAALERFFTTQFAYTLELPATREQASLEHFLLERRAGHCEYFSTAMTVLLRAAGIPARNVNGFLGGEWNEDEGYLAVTQNAAHSWVEVWFPGFGWVTFDPTPPAGRGGGLGGAGAGSLGWSLRLWMDGVEHRWFKWVLFYDLDKQLGMLNGVSRLMSNPPLHMPKPRLPESAGAWWLLAAAAAGAGIVLWRHLSAKKRAAGVTRIYLEMRASYAAAGYPHPPALPPRALLDELRAEDAPASEPGGAAEELIEGYLHARFGNAPAGAAAEAAESQVREQLIVWRLRLREHQRLRRRDRVHRRFSRSSASG